MAGISFTMNLPISKFSTETSKWEEFSLLHDPIGAEVDHLDVKYDSWVYNPLSREVEVIRSMGQEALDNSSQTLKQALRDIASGNLNKMPANPVAKIMVESEMKRILAERPQKMWTDSKIDLHSRWANERTILQEKRAKVKFDTTRHFIDLQLERARYC
jgi:hypothetical protein